MGNTFFTCDQHWGHAKSIQYSNRPFSSVEEMDEVMIDNWNKVVGPDDRVYHLGDLTLGSDAMKYIRRLRGHLHILEYGFHHDKRWLKERHKRMSPMWSSLNGLVFFEPPVLVLEHMISVPIVLCHFPFETWDRMHYGSFHLHGHSHGNLPQVPRRLDVGVDVHNFTPISLEEVINILDR